MYDYRAEMKEDIKNYIEDNDWENYDDISREELEEKLYDEMWIDDSVTGNGSGSYTFNSHEAFLNLEGNLDLLGEANEEFGGCTDVLKDGAEACDVTIRCYLLGEVLNEVLDELWDDISTE